jgi:hypothetical protein
VRGSANYCRFWDTTLEKVADRMELDTREEQSGNDLEVEFFPQDQNRRNPIGGSK